MWFLINPLTAALAAFTLLSYVLIYTPLKPLTPLNTLVGAVPGAIPPVLGWTAVRGTFDAQSLALLTILFVWQIPHFMAIAILYKQDYATAGFKMLPVVDHDLSRTGRQIIIYSVALIGASCLPFVLHMAGTVYLVSAIVMSIGFLLVGMECAAKGTRAAARKLFLVSIIYLPLLLSVMMFTRIPN
jgi:protoheme IX farnesyltransferase